MYQVEQLLSSYKNIGIKLNTIDIEISMLKSDKGNLPSMSYEEKVSTSRNTSSVIENELIKTESEIERLEQIKRRLEYDKARVDNSLKVLTEREREIIELRYLKSNLSYQIIADRMLYSRSQISRDCKNALKKLSKVLFYY